MATVKETTPGTQDLATLQLVIQQHEGIFGPLITLSSDQNQNIMEFHVGPSPNMEHRAILQTYTGHPPAKEGYNLVCIATCFVSGTSSLVAAYRKNA